VVEAGQADGETDGTRLFGALSSVLSDVPVDRVAGAFLITDGRVHDIPANAAALGFQAPVHALITGRKDERDRRIAISAAPRFGIVGQAQTITYRLDDQGVSGDRAKIVVRRDGEVISERSLASGQTANVEIDIKHAGPNIVEIEASPLDNELTLVNNRAVVAIDGVRDKLRVLLVSGEPHSGERTWRNLLKSDASVDLVHFTILRPPEKQDGTPINELSLIAFPTRELFQQRINEFQLIIFDRYARQGVLPIAYFDNIARYVTAMQVATQQFCESADPAAAHQAMQIMDLAAEIHKQCMVFRLKLTLEFMFPALELAPSLLVPRYQAFRESVNRLNAIQAQRPMPVAPKATAFAVCSGVSALVRTCRRVACEHHFMS